MQVEECPQCGAPAAPSERKCRFCKAEFFVTSLAYLGNMDRGAIDKYVRHYKGLVRADPEEGEGVFALGLCYLQLGLYPLATKNLEKAIELVPECADVYYYYALALIGGRRPRTLALAEVRQVEQYLRTAAQLDRSKPVFDYLAAILKYDYYRANGLSVPPPTETELIGQAKGKPHDPVEVDRLLELVPVNDQRLIASLRA